jgi:hypothetical protein
VKHLEDIGGMLEVMERTYLLFWDKEVEEWVEE